MGGKLVHYHADDLTEMLLDDILFDTVIELQMIEQKERKTHTINEGK
jgi:hypothetical protein